VNEISCLKFLDKFDSFSYGFEKSVESYRIWIARMISLILTSYYTSFSKGQSPNASEECKSHCIRRPVVEQQRRSVFAEMTMLTNSVDQAREQTVKGTDLVIDHLRR